VLNPTIFAALAQCNTDCVVGTLVAVDVTSGRAVRDTTLLGTSDLAYRNGKLLVARSSGHTRISILDPETLAVVDTRVLPWDPQRAVFSSDGRYMYALRAQRHVSQVRIADGVVTASVSIGSNLTEPPVLTGIAIDPTEQLLGITSSDFNTREELGEVTLVRIAGESLAIAHTLQSQPIPNSNCSRIPANPAFDRSGARLATFDANCEVFDVYVSSTGVFESIASARFPRGNGSNYYGNTISDVGGQFWAMDEEHLFRSNPTDPLRHASYPLGVPSNAGLVTDVTGSTIYLFPHDPRRNGVFIVNPDTGARTRLTWSLDLVPYDSLITAMTYAVR
jgi:DNA-binding beta-propeller fold protein YncE